MSRSTPAPVFFASAREFGDWLTLHHASATELTVGFYRVASGTPSLTWSEAVQEALCYGWIDGLVKQLDDTRYTRRFTPRRKGSNWSAVNIRYAEALIAEGRMQPAGQAVFHARTNRQSGGYSFEQSNVQLPDDLTAQLRQHVAALAFWDLQPKSYRTAVAWWIVSAKRADTRQRRFDSLIKHSDTSERVPQFTSAPRLSSSRTSS